MLLPDVNVVLAGFRADHDHHRTARRFLDEARSRTAAIGLGDVALSSVVRLATNARVFIRPDTAEAVLEYLDILLEPPGQLLRAGTRHWSRFAELCRLLQLRGNLVPDAYLVALALEQGAELVTFDRGFGRYPGLRWRCLLDE
ncbi:MAG: PIN domain-containing protein [Actinomycetota bacterium]|nr:PIN domain-containing protein [Actinomycetota bacterium]